MKTLTVVEVLARVLDSPHECDKWLCEVEKAYIRQGGKDIRLIPPTKRELIGRTDFV